MCDLQPVNHHIMRELVDELIHDSVNPYRATDEFELSILRVTEDEMVGIEFRKILSTNSSRELGDR